MAGSRRKETITLVLGLLVLVLAVANAQVWFFRADITRNHAFTLSPYARSWLESLPNPLRITYHVSPALEGNIPAIRQMEDLLEEYRSASGGRFQLEIHRVDPAKDAPTLEQKGFQAQQYQVVKDNGMAVEMVYSGLEIHYLSRTRIIPFIADPAQMEYQAILAAQGLVADRLPRIGILSGKLPSEPGASAELLHQTLGGDFEGVALPQGQPIPADLDLLLVLGDETLDASDARNVDQFARTGKRVVLALDGLGIDAGRGINPRPIANHPLADLAADWGITIDPGWVLDRTNASLPLQKTSGGFSYEVDQPYPAWIRLQGASLDADHPLVAHVPALDLLWASPLGIAADRPDIKVLVRSSPEGVILEHPVSADPQVLEGELASGKAVAGGIPLVASLEGTVESPFPERKGQKGKVRVIFMGDSDFASDLIRISGSQGNIEMIRNLFEWSAWGRELLDLRNREVREARLDRITDRQERSWVIGMVQTGLLGIIPALVILAGLLRMAGRKRKAARIREDDAS